VLFEVATDKVDSEIPSPADGIVNKILFPAESLVPVGKVVAVIEMEPGEQESGKEKEIQEEVKAGDKNKPGITTTYSDKSLSAKKNESNRFYSPLVRKIAEEEGISTEELKSVEGSGVNGRVRGKDILKFIEKKNQESPEKIPESPFLKQTRLHSARLQIIFPALKISVSYIVTERMFSIL